MGERKGEHESLLGSRHWQLTRQLVAAGCILLGLLGIGAQLDLWRSG